MFGLALEFSQSYLYIIYIIYYIFILLFYIYYYLYLFIYLLFSLCARHAPWGTQFCSVELLLDASLNNSENLCSICLKFSAQLGFGTLNLRINLRCKTQTSKRLQCCNANTHWFHLCIARDLSFLLLTAARKVLLLFQTQEKSGSHRKDATHVL